MSYEIDETTGLPVLPEGHRWVIAPKREWGIVSVVDHPRILAISIEKFWPVRVSTVMTKKRLFLARRVKTYEAIEEKKRIISIDLKGNNPIAARNAANKAMRDFEALKMRESLIGTYPPKKLEV